jgi:hypothetical protein
MKNLLLSFLFLSFFSQAFAQNANPAIQLYMESSCECFSKSYVIAVPLETRNFITKIFKASDEELVAIIDNMSDEQIQFHLSHFEKIDANIEKGCSDEEIYKMVVAKYPNSAAELNKFINADENGEDFSEYDLIFEKLPKCTMMSEAMMAYGYLASLLVEEIEEVEEEGEED